MGFILPDYSLCSTEERRGYGALGAVVGAFNGLLVGALRSLPKKNYTDTQKFLQDFEPWLAGESEIPKRLAKMVKIII